MKHDVQGQPKPTDIRYGEQRYDVRTFGFGHEVNNNAEPRRKWQETIQIPGETVDLIVGQQFSMWVDITSQCQLIAQDTYWGWGLHSCSGTAQYRKNKKDGYGVRWLKINVYKD
jgi:hypothetical protein